MAASSDVAIFMSCRPILAMYASWLGNLLRRSCPIKSSAPGDTTVNA